MTVLLAVAGYIVGSYLSQAGSANPGEQPAGHTGPPPTVQELPADIDESPTALRRKLDRLRVAVEDTGHHYRRKDWPHWSVHSNGCDTREIELKRSAKAYRKGHEITYERCAAVGNAYWVSSYDNISTRDSGELDIDHIVPLAEAARSGTRAWTKADRERFANDMGSNLIAVTATSNRSKGDQDPGRWRPPNRYSWCNYATSWIDVKTRYHLSIDDTEAAGLRSMLNTCS